MSRRFALICALVLSSFTVSTTREARAQGQKMTVSVLRRTAVYANPSFASPTIAFLNPSTFEVTQVRVVEGFVRLLLRQIDRASSTGGYGYIAGADVAVDSGTTEPVRAQTNTPARPPTATVPPPRRDTVAPPRAAAPVRTTQSGQFALESTAGLRPHNVTVEPATHMGKRGVRVAMSDEAQRRVQQLPAGEQAQLDKFVVIEGTDFANGVIEAEISGAPAADATEGARGFVGIAFRVHPDLKTYDAFYLRPTNGRADDQERRNHSVQYISHPDWTWSRMRRETPGRYEAYVDLVPDVWTPIRIEVRGTKARLFVNGQSQPTLVVNDVKTGEQGRGAIALWIDTGTNAHFRNVRVTP